jgi:hypothetical protein
MKPIVRPWTDADNDPLKAFLTEGLSAAREAVALGGKIKNVKVQARGAISSPTQEAHGLAFEHMATGASKII